MHETLLHISEAKQAGADHSLALPPAYWVSLMTPEGLESFYGDV